MPPKRKSDVLQAVDDVIDLSEPQAATSGGAKKDASNTPGAAAAPAAKKARVSDAGEGPSSSAKKGKVKEAAAPKNWWEVKLEGEDGVRYSNDACPFTS